MAHRWYTPWWEAYEWALGKVEAPSAEIASNNVETYIESASEPTTLGFLQWINSNTTSALYHILSVPARENWLYQDGVKISAGSSASYQYKLALNLTNCISLILNEKLGVEYHVWKLDDTNKYAWIPEKNKSGKGRVLMDKKITKLE